MEPKAAFRSRHTEDRNPIEGGPLPAGTPARRTTRLQRRALLVAPDPRGPRQGRAVRRRGAEARPSPRHRVPARPSTGARCGTRSSQGTDPPAASRAGPAKPCATTTRDGDKPTVFAPGTPSGSYRPQSAGGTLVGQGRSHGRKRTSRIRTAGPRGAWRSSPRQPTKRPLPSKRQ